MPKSKTKPTEVIDRTYKTVSAAAVKKSKIAIADRAHALERLKIEYVSTDMLKPNTYNPNRQSAHDFELLLRSITEDGFTQPIITLPDLTIVDGEHRWRAARHLELKQVPIVKVDMTPEQMRIATLRHNRARGSEDITLAAEVLRDLRELGALDWATESYDDGRRRAKTTRRYSGTGGVGG